MSPIKRLPVFSILSLVTLLGNAMVVAASFLLLIKMNIFVVFFGLGFGVLFSAIGSLFALVSLLRREKYLILSLLALALNCAALYWLCSIHQQPWGP